MIAKGQAQTNVAPVLMSCDSPTISEYSQYWKVIYFGNES